MSLTRISNRYAKSLLDLASDQNTLDKVVQDINMLQQALKNRDFYLFIKSPIVNTSKKQQIFNSLFKGKVTDVTMAFLDIVVRKGRENYLPEIAAEFMEKYKTLKGITTVLLTTAVPVSAKQIEEIESKLRSSNLVATHVEFEQKVDPSLIGGFVVQIGDQLIDSSVARKLKLFKKDFIENEYIKTI